MDTAYYTRTCTRGFSRRVRGCAHPSHGSLRAAAPPVIPMWCGELKAIETRDQWHQCPGTVVPYQTRVRECKGDASQKDATNTNSAQCLAMLCTQSAACKASIRAWDSATYPLALILECAW